MRILAIDPGNEKSAWVLYDADEKRIRNCGIEKNSEQMNLIPEVIADVLVIEMVACYGMPVGKEVFETCVWIGRFIERWQKAWRFVYRLEVKMALCHDSRAKDANIRQAIIDRFSATGGGACPQVGTKKQPGPLYGVSKDIWSALGVALTATEKL